MQFQIFAYLGGPLVPDQPLHESDSTREIVQNGIHSSLPSRNKIMIRVTPNIGDLKKNGACIYEYWSGTYAYNDDVNGSMMCKVKVVSMKLFSVHSLSSTIKLIIMSHLTYTNNLT